MESNSHPVHPPTYSVKVDSHKRRPQREVPALPLTPSIPPSSFNAKQSQPLRPRLRRSPGRSDLSNSRQLRKPPTPAKQFSRGSPSSLPSSSPLRLRDSTKSIKPILTPDYLEHSTPTNHRSRNSPSKSKPINNRPSLDEKKRYIDTQLPSRTISSTPGSRSTQTHSIKTSSQTDLRNRRTTDREGPFTQQKARLQKQKLDFRPSTQQHSRANSKKTSSAQPSLPDSKNLDSRRLQQNSKNDKDTQHKRQHPDDEVLSPVNGPHTSSIYVCLDEDPDMSRFLGFINCAYLKCSEPPVRFKPPGSSTTSFASDSSVASSSVQARQVLRFSDIKVPSAPIPNTVKWSMNKVAGSGAIQPERALTSIRYYVANKGQAVIVDPFVSQDVQVMPMEKDSDIAAIESVLRSEEPLSALTLSHFFSIERERAETLWHLMYPFESVLPKTEQSISREDSVQTFCKFKKSISLQIPVSDRCQYSNVLFKLQDHQPARIKLDELLRAHYCIRKPQRRAVAMQLASLWKTIFGNETTGSETLGAQLAAFLEIITQQGPPEVPNLILPLIDGKQNLRHAPLAHLSNLIATHVKNIDKTEGNLLAYELNFFRTVTHSKQNAILSVFEETVDKLESEDVVLCFWLFLVGVEGPDDPGLRSRLWKKACQRIVPCEANDAGPLQTAMYFLARYPNTTFFDPLDRAMLALTPKREWEDTWQKASQRKLYTQLSSFKDEARVTDSGKLRWPGSLSSRFKNELPCRLRFLEWKSKKNEKKLEDLSKAQFLEMD